MRLVVEELLREFQSSAGILNSKSYEWIILMI